jgi:hypothetical protein
MVLTVSFALSPVTGFVCHRRFADIGVSGPLGLTSPSAKLDASVGASGPHDFTVRTQRHSSFDVAASIAFLPNVRDDRDTPLWRAGTMQK